MTRSNSPADGPVQAIYHETTEHGDTAHSPRDSQIQQLAHQTEAPGEMRLTSKSRPERKPTGAIQQVTFTEQAAAPSPECPPQFIINQCPPEPRWAAPCPNPFAPGMVGGQCESTLLLEKFPDEYLCDGGDRALPVHYDSYNRLGLDTEDTVAEYTDHTGKNRVKASNRVCVYAPRFATVRTISRPHEDSHLNRIADVDHSAGTNAMHTRLKASLHVKQEMTGRVAVRSRAGGLESEQLQGDISQTKRLAIHDKLINVYQDLNFVQFGSAKHSDAARLNFGIQAGLVWSREEYPVIGAKTDSAMEGVYEAHAATIVGIDDKKSDEPGNLRIVKLADKNTAVPGDVIEFTLRYDNLGPNAVHHVRIVDNLTPRLQYVDDSATSDREGRLVVQDNGEGSLVLVWELTEPLQPNAGGVVTFKAKVR
ncbi:MAG: DUF11 domain-containing protein [Candidatus Saccharimonas sp.]|nr:DUF11 domain-containing protein [Planctomycetaceae bacterium]